MEFTQEQLDEELAKLKNDVGKIQTDKGYRERSFGHLREQTAG